MLDKISVLPGRVRFRSNKIHGNKVLSRYLHSYIEGLFGVNYSSINYNTGSILIVYDDEKTNYEQLEDNIRLALSSEGSSKREALKQNELYYKTIEKRDKSKRKILFLGVTYLLLKLKHATIGKFSISSNVAVLEAASVVTIVGGYPLLKTLYKKFSRNLPTDSDILLNLTATSFTLLRESSKGVFVLVLKSLSDYVKYSAEVECMRTLNSGMNKTLGMAWLILENNQEILVPVSSLNIGDTINIHKGEVSPVKGKITSGNAVVNTLYQTGQPVVSHLGKGNKILEGATVVFGEIKVKVESIPVETEKKDISLDNLSIHKQVGAYQNRISKFAMGVAGLNYIFTGSLLNALSVLLVLTPSATATALSNGMKNYVAALKKHNIYLRNPNTFENIVNTNSIMFDKTGTLTYGNMRIMNIESFSKDYSSEELLKICAACEADTYHPISITLQDYAGGEYDISKVKSSVLVPSQGIEAIYDNHKLLIGNVKLFEKHRINITNGINKYKQFERDFYYPLFIAVDNKLAGIISMKDEMRENTDLLIRKLKYEGIKDINLITGDNYEKACNFAESIGIENVFAECSYEDKLTVIMENCKLHRVMMVGDGINDIDAMRAAGVSVSFANSACDKIKLHSDCIIFEDNIDRLADLIYMSQRSYKFMRQSIAFSEFYNIVFGALAFFQYFDAFTAKSLNTINSLVVLLLNRRIGWIAPDRVFQYEINRNKTLKERNLLM